MDDKNASRMTMAEFSSSLLVEIKSLSNTLKPVSKTLYENNNKLLNELLIAKDEQLCPMVSKLLSHLLHISQNKNFTHTVLGILTKVVNCIKTFPSKQNQASEQLQAMQIILHHFINILFSIANQHKQAQDISLRVIQTNFSLIDLQLMPFFNNSILTRMYSICFEFCKGSSMLQNISVSALFALTQCLFEYGSISQSFQILDAFLDYLFTQKRVVWIKSTDLKGLMWDLVSTAIRSFTANHIIKLDLRPTSKQYLIKMYEIATNCIFLKNNNNKDFYVVLTQAQQNAQQKVPQQSIHEFMRYFKAYLTFSNTLSIEAYRVVDKEFVGFRQTIPKLVMICQLERNARMYIFLEAICQLLLNQYDIPLSVEKGLVFMEILGRISQELCLCNESIKVNWEVNEYFLDKLCHEEPKITDGDFVKLIKNTIFQLRQKYEKDTDLIQCKNNYKQCLSARSSNNSSIVLPSNMGTVKKWEHFIKYCIKIVRYLSSLNYVNEEDEEDPTRKIILELQYWFLICPVSKAKNMVLQQLLVTANILTNKMQAVKVSQSVQIGSNILYGYFEDLDSIGLTIIFKMMAGIKADWEEGKSFQQLDEIYNLTSNVFTEERFIKNDGSFSMTIQALVQCANSILADIQQPKQKSLLPASSSFKRLFKMVDYLTQRMMVIIQNNPSKACAQWNFITAFFITLCFNKNVQIKEKGIQKIGLLVRIILKAQLLQQWQQKKEQDIMGLYLELCKAQIKQIDLIIVEQLKMYMPRIKQQSALMDGFRIAKIFYENVKNNKDMIGSLHDLQEILIKQCLFRIVDVKYLRMILEGLQAKFSEKNEEYRLINLVWSIADHMKELTPKENIPQQFLDLWEILFKDIWFIGDSSSQCETKQSAIHAMTQILAQSQSTLPLDFSLHITLKYFQQLVLLLLGILPNSIIQPDKTSETAKISLKNYIKLFKMLIGIDNKTFEQTEEIKKCLSSTNQSITKYIRQHVQSKITGQISLQLVLQLLNFIKLVEEDEGFSQYQTEKDLKEMFHCIQDLIKMCSQSGEKKGKIDLNSHLYKKKVKPLIEKIQENQSLRNQKLGLIKEEKPNEQNQKLNEQQQKQNEQQQRSKEQQQKSIQQPEVQIAKE